MGIDLWNLRFLLEAHKTYGALGETIQMGRQEIHLGEHEHPVADSMLREYGFDANFNQARDGGRYADEGLLQFLGATNVQSADASAYEGAALVHDFNDPLPVEQHQRWDTVFDGGSLEHIFNVPTALANEMNMIKIGGRLLSSLPANNWLGHGFYQFSQELPFRTFTPANGFNLTAVMFSDMAGGWQFHDVLDQLRRAGGEIGHTSGRNGLMFMANKITHVEPFRRWSQQSDYNNEWEAFDGGPMSVIPNPPVSRRFDRLRQVFRARQ